MMSTFSLAVSLLLLAPSGAQLGCPMYGCQSGGLFSQADVDVGETAHLQWSTPVGFVNENRTTGCVGNDAAIICPVNMSEGVRGFSSFDFNNGSILWNETLLTSPSTPILIDDKGGVIGTDGMYMVNLFHNGSDAGHPINMSNSHGFLRPPTNVLFLSDIGQFFYISKSHGGLFLYGPDGSCTASYYLLPSKLDYNNSWVPAVDPVIDVDTRRVYIIAHQQNEMKGVGKTRLFAVSINLQPPYLREEWNITLNPEHEIDDSTGVMLVRDSTVFIGFKTAFTVVKDQMKNGTVIRVGPTYEGYTSFASYSDGSDTTSGSFSVWAATTGGFFLHNLDQYGNRTAVVLTLDLMPKTISFSQIYSTNITSKLSLFGYHPDSQTLVFAVAALYSLPDETISDERFDDAKVDLNAEVDLVAPLSAVDAEEIPTYLEDERPAVSSSFDGRDRLDKGDFRKALENSKEVGSRDLAVGAYVIAAKVMPSTGSSENAPLLKTVWTTQVRTGNDAWVEGYILGVRSNQLVGYLKSNYLYDGEAGWVFSINTEKSKF